MTIFASHLNCNQNHNTTAGMQRVINWLRVSHEDQMRNAMSIHRVLNASCYLAYFEVKCLCPCQLLYKQQRSKTTVKIAEETKWSHQVHRRHHQPGHFPFKNITIRPSPFFPPFHTTCIHML